ARRACSASSSAAVDSGLRAGPGSAARPAEASFSALTRVPAVMLAVDGDDEPSAVLLADVRAVETSPKATSPATKASTGRPPRAASHARRRMPRKVARTIRHLTAGLIRAPWFQ